MDSIPKPHYSVRGLFGFALQLATLFLIVNQSNTLKGYHEDAVRGRAALMAIETTSKQALLDFMSRTVDRWDALQRNNHQLVVPKVEEPLDSPHLNPEELDRKLP